MTLEIDDEVFGPHIPDCQEIQLDLAIGLFMSRRVTLGRGADIAGINQTDFLTQLGQRGIPLHYDLDDVEMDLKTVDQLRAP
jgi:predicted HTH domain antitoxin